MARKKSIIRLRLPFFKLKINKHTLFNIFGFLLIGTAILFALSFLQSGAILIKVNQIIFSRFGAFSIFIPVIIFFIASHFFNSNKLKLIKPHLTIGLILIFIAFLGILKSGLWGVAIINNLVTDFTLLGAIIILMITFIIGVILFFNTSVDVFLLFIINSIKFIFSFIGDHLIAGTLNSSKDKKVDKNDTKDEFIQVRPTPVINQPQVSHHQLAVKESDELTIKPYAMTTEKWQFPPLSLLSEMGDDKADAGDIGKSSDTIEKTLDSFGIRAKIFEVNPGPTVTQYAIQITQGTKLSKITALSNDLALALAAPTGQVRIEAPIPGRSLVGIEIPNRRAAIVTLKKLLTSDNMVKNHDPLFVPLGLDVSGISQAVSIDRMPHILIAGTTGSGKSVMLNSWICSLLYRATPAQVRLILVDPKRVELTYYNGIPHLMTEVIVDPKKIISALNWTVREMENRYKQFSKAGVRNIEGYNNKKGLEPIPNLIFVIDELADLMMFAANEAEDAITRIAQMARATGIHLILATQRPSVDIITGLMKANIPARIAFNVASMIDSRVVLDMPGAEKLLGKGDMLFLPPDQAKPKRIQGPYIAEKDVINIVDFFKEKIPEVHYTEEVTAIDKNTRIGMSIGGTGQGEDQLFEDAKRVIFESGKASASFLQRKLSIGYSRAAKILDQLEAAGFIGPQQGAKSREIFSNPQNQEVNVED